MNVWKFLGSNNATMAQFVGNVCSVHIKDNHLITWIVGDEKMDWMFKTSHIVSVEDHGNIRVAHTANSIYTFEKIEVKIKEFGYGGHFCCCNMCEFRRNTHLYYGDKEIMVSTVGELYDRIENKYRPTDTWQMYETLVAECDGDDWEEETDHFTEMDMDFEELFGKFTRKQLRKEANKKHDVIVEEMALRLVTNNIQ